VQVYEAEDVNLLESLAKKIRSEIVMDGLVWFQEHKIVEVAFGAKKLEMSMIVEDDKVNLYL
jgi:elongation factor 1-beta